MRIYFWYRVQRLSDTQTGGLGGEADRFGLGHLSLSLSFYDYIFHNFL